MSVDLAQIGVTQPYEGADHLSPSYRMNKATFKVRRDTTAVQK